MRPPSQEALPFLRPDQTFDTVAAGTLALNIIYTESAFVDGLIDNDEKIASSKNHINSRPECKDRYPIQEQNS